MKRKQTPYIKKPLLFVFSVLRGKYLLGGIKNSFMSLVSNLCHDYELKKKTQLNL